MGRRAERGLNGSHESDSGLAVDPAAAAAQAPEEVEGGTISVDMLASRHSLYENGHSLLTATGNDAPAAADTPTNGRSRRRRQGASDAAAASGDGTAGAAAAPGDDANPGQEEPAELGQVRFSELEGGVGTHGQTLRKNLSPVDTGTPTSPTTPLGYARSRRDHEDVNKFGEGFEQRKKDQRGKEGTRLQVFKAGSTVLSDKLKDDLEDTVKKAGNSNVRSLRFMSRARQIEQPLWKFLVTCGLSPLEEQGPDALVHGVEQEENGALADKRCTYFQQVQKLLGDSWFRYGPVGEQGLHNFFLLAFSNAPGWNKSLLVELGKRVVCEYYNEPELLSVPYNSDLHTWKALSYVAESGHPDDDGGLYTGETILHIAVANQDEALVDWLLGKGASITARAQGAFFMPPVIRRRDTKFTPTSWTRFIARLQERDPILQPYMTENANGESACYFGEYVMSFAACVGNLRICQKIKLHAEAVLAEKGQIGGRWDPDVAVLRPTRILARGRTNSAGASSFARAKSLVARAPSAPPPNSSAVNDHPRGVLAGSGENVFYSMDALMNAADSLGNTALHLTVVHQNMEAFDWLMKNGAARSLVLLNHQGLTPFTLAAREGCVAEFEHILKTHMQLTMWNFSNVQSVMTTLEQFDSFRMKGKPADGGSAGAAGEGSSPEAEEGGEEHAFPLHNEPLFRSAIEVIVDHEVVEFADNVLFNQLITEKYNAFGRRMHLWGRAVPYLAYVMLYSLYVILRTQEVQQRSELLVMEGILDAPVSSRDVPPEMAGLYMWLSGTPQIGQDTPLFFVSRVCEVVLLVNSVFLSYFGWTERRISPRDLEAFDASDMLAIIDVLHKNLSFCTRSFIFLCNLLAFGFHVAGEEKSEFNSMACGAIAVFCHLLEMAMPFKAAGVLITMIYRIFVGDVVIFLGIYFVFLGAFGLATFLTFQLSPHPESLALYGDDIRMDRDLSAVLLKLTYVSFGTVDYTALIFQSQSPAFTFVLHFGWIIISLVLLLNLLIAMMNGRFDEDAKQSHRLWIFPLAHTVLRLERSLTGTQRARKRTGQAAGADAQLLSAEEIQRQKYFLIQLEHADEPEHAEPLEFGSHPFPLDAQSDAHDSASKHGHHRNHFKDLLTPMRRGEMKAMEQNTVDINALRKEVDKLRILVENRAGLRQTIMNLDRENRGGGLSAGLLKRNRPKT